jgi:hypothetical protein
MNKYVLATYFINTIFSTVGFGDIAPRNVAERLYSIFCMYCGTLVFGTLLSEVAPPPPLVLIGHAASFTPY